MDSSIRRSPIAERLTAGGCARSTLGTLIPNEIGQGDELWSIDPFGS